MKFNGVTLILLVIFVFVLISSEGSRNLLQATTQALSPIPTHALVKGQQKPGYYSNGNSVAYIPYGWGDRHM
nr:hypothetical protein CTI12_AA294010 [Tanacetum cinerariifolium]